MEFEKWFAAKLRKLRAEYGDSSQAELARSAE
jgi:hypothetical protein